MLITGNVAVDPLYLGQPGDVAFHPNDLTDPEALRRWKTWAEACQASGTPTIVQINHPGRQAHPAAGERSFFSKTIAPSAVPLSLSGGWLERLAGWLFLGTPREMTIKDINRVVEQFTGAAKMAFVAGFKGVEVHAAHGYLLTQFLSPKVNLRTDEYGGTPEKRLQLLLRILQEVRAATSKEFCVGVKLNSADFQLMGLYDEEVLQQVKAISDAGVDFIEISGGTYEKPLMAQSREGVPEKPIRESTRLREAYFADFAQKAREVAGSGTSIMLSGGFRSRLGMASAISEGSCDLIGIGRPACTEPHFPKDKMLSTDVPDEDAVVKSFVIPNGSFWRRVPIVGLHAESAWHAKQMKIFGSGKAPDLNLKLRFADF